ncbi:MAG TPA: protein kinase [Labilithrix sp.]|nr:protein kinase [Labilithrix sp.]
MALHEHDYEQGDVIRGEGGDYTVLAVLGSGGMGAVYLVKDRNIGRRFVLKVLHRWLAHRRDLKERFEHEARALGHLSHEGIIEIFHLGRTRDNRMPYYLMEVLSGESLGDAIRRHGKLALFPALGIATKMLYALQHAHERGVVHRDIKPDNVFLHQGKSSEPIVKLLDFGILKLAESAEDPNVFIGTPRYAAPEQLAGGVVGPKADLYSAGIVLFQMLTGRLPFESHGPSLQAMIETLPLNAPSLSDYGDCPRELVELVASMLAKDPAARPVDAFTIASDLQRIRRAFAPDRDDVHEHVTAEVITSARQSQRELSQITNAHLAAPTEPDVDIGRLMSALRQAAQPPSPADIAFAEVPITGFESTAEERIIAGFADGAELSPRAPAGGVDRDAPTVLPRARSGMTLDDGLPGSIRYVTDPSPVQRSPKGQQVTVPMTPPRQPIRQHLTVPMPHRPLQHGDDTRTPEPQTTALAAEPVATAGWTRLRSFARLPRSVSLKALLLAGLTGISIFALGLRLMAIPAKRPAPVAASYTEEAPASSPRANLAPSASLVPGVGELPTQSASNSASDPSRTTTESEAPVATTTPATATATAATARPSASIAPSSTTVRRAAASVTTSTSSPRALHGDVGFDP